MLRSSNHVEWVVIFAYNLCQYIWNKIQDESYNLPFIDFPVTAYTDEVAFTVTDTVILVTFVTEVIENMKVGVRSSEILLNLDAV